MNDPIGRLGSPSPVRPLNIENYYTFIGWYDESENKYAETVTADATYTARYETKEYIHEYVNLSSFAGMSVIMKSSLTINYKSPASNFVGYEKVYAEFEIEHADGVETVIVEDGIINGKYLDFHLKGIAAKEMNDNVRAVVYAIKDGVKYEFNSLDEYSIAIYAINRINNSKSTQKERTALVDMLNYGSQAQKYFKYRTDSLANSRLTEEQMAYASYTEGEEIELESVFSYETSPEDQITIAGASVLFVEKELK
jgi:hypothetical protein